jgi:hypothetical protein
MKTPVSKLALSLICLHVLSGLNSVHADVKTTAEDGAIKVSVSGKPVLTYHTNTVSPPEGTDKVYARSGFIHPIYSPSGKVLTDDFPVGHAHQHALFSAWTRATFKHEVVDFWNQHGGSGNAKHLDVGEVGGSSFVVDLLQFSNNNGPAIRERWAVEVEDSSDPFVIDIEIEQECATDEEVYLHPYRYGGFGFRGSSHWNGEDEGHYEGAMKVLTSDGITDIEASNHTRPRWVAVYGPIDGVDSGLVIMNHPTSFRHPQPVRVHPTMPYFVFSPVVEGSFILKPGMTYNANYRIVAFDGVPNAERIEKWYKEYTSIHQSQ